MPTPATAVAQRLRDGIAQVVVGNDETIFAFLLALLAGGHILVEGVPGTAKTLLVRVLALLLGVKSARIQFTPDLMPADVLGTTVFNPKTTEFSLRAGPVFTNLLLADEINRTPPKTQSALLQAMEERQVTIDGATLDLPAPFLVCATQNPIEYEGTYPLPEAQLDRFFVRARTAYPARAQELELLARGAAGFDARRLPEAGVAQTVSGDDLLAAQRAIRGIFAAEPLLAYLQAIVAKTREAPDLALGASPRAALALLAAAQAAAAIEGRDFATPDDVKTVAPLVLAHRLIVRPEAEIEGVTAEAALTRILAAIAVPKDVRVVAN
jgi:MoxR-like ATPase